MDLVEALYVSWGVPSSVLKDNDVFRFIIL